MAVSRASPETAPADGPGLGSCPRCRASTLRSVTVSGLAAGHCPGCEGLWLPRNELDLLVARAGAEAALHSAQPGVVAPPPAETTIHYLKCPACGTLMNRHNFQLVSGIILDTCSTHGAWLDRGELAAIYQFVAAGGLERAEVARARRAAPTPPLAIPPAPGTTDSTWTNTTSVAFPGTFDGVLSVVSKILSSRW